MAAAAHQWRRSAAGLNKNCSGTRSHHSPPSIDCRHFDCSGASRLPFKRATRVILCPEGGGGRNVSAFAKPQPIRGHLAISRVESDLTIRRPAPPTAPDDQTIVLDFLSLAIDDRPYLHLSAWVRQTGKTRAYRNGWRRENYRIPSLRAVERTSTRLDTNTSRFSKLSSSASPSVNFHGRQLGIWGNLRKPGGLFLKASKTDRRWPGHRLGIEVQNPFIRP